MTKELKEKFIELTKTVKYNYTLVNANTEKAKEIKNKYANIRYANIFQAYAKPSSTKVVTALACAQMVKDLATSVEGYVDNQGIQGAGKDNYNWLAKITSAKNNLKIYVYCTKCNNFITVEEIS